MSFLAPLFAAGLAAVAAPVVFHLIRRRPAQRVPFGSLMFLAPTPPRPTRRGKLEHLVLLALRAAALVLIGLAFMRPFVRTDEPVGPGDADQRRVAVVVDASASMRRGDLWPKALATADAALADCRAVDQVAVFAFDSTPRAVLDFRESATLDPSRRLAVARDRVRQLTPAWGRTELGKALSEAVAAVAEAVASGSRGPGRVVLVSDLQQGAKLDGLGDGGWPPDVELDLKVVTDGGGNAGLERLADPTADEVRPGDPAALRVRVANDAGSKAEAYRLAWVDAAGNPAGTPIDVYVPPGERRVVRVPRPSGGEPPTALRLLGDDHPFDNTVYVPAAAKDELTVLYVGTDPPDDPSGQRYFLERVWADTPERSVKVVGKRPDEPLNWDDVRPLPLVVATGETTPANADVLRRYVSEGGTLLYPVTAAGPAGTLAAVAGVPAFDVPEAEVDRYALLRDVDFGSELFAPLAGPQYGDFTKVHFWKHRRVDAGKLAGRVLARFDDGDPAVVEAAVGRGRLVVLASGWHPADGQLSRSSKFVPLMTAALDRRAGRRSSAPGHRVGDRVPLPPTAEAVTVRKPDGAAVPLPAGATAFDGTDIPGVYAVQAARPWAFGVDVDPAESLTSPLPPDTLERAGGRLAGRAPAGPAPPDPRTLRDAEQESRQAYWRWLLAAAFAVLVAETILSGRLSRPRADIPEAVTP